MFENEHSLAATVVGSFDAFNVAHVHFFNIISPCMIKIMSKLNVLNFKRVNNNI
jgi:hypothetical protein